MNCKVTIKSKTIKAILYITVLLAVVIETYADNGKVNIPDLYKKNYVLSPEMAALKYMYDFPVNYSTGTVDVKIPLYTIECGELTLPIYLSYNTSGVKVNEPCGWVGQNWTLHAEPMITRIVKGHVDCGYSDPYKTDHDTYSWAKEYTDSNISNSTDAMPDEYYYSLPTGSGMFVYSTVSNKYISIPYDDVVISSEKRIIAQDGTTYMFAGGREYINNYAPVLETGWHASKIISANMVDTICFSYGNVTDYHIPRHEEHITVVDNFQSRRFPRYGYDSLEDAGYNSPVNNVASKYPDPEEVLNAPIVYITNDKKTKAYRVDSSHNLVQNDLVVDDIGLFPDIRIFIDHLSRIMWKGYSVEFVTESTNISNINSRLKTITIKNMSNTVIKKIDFHYNKEIDKTNIYTRHFLTGVSIASPDRSICEVYEMDYNKMPEVPANDSKEYDFWGYYNGWHDSLIPQTKLYTYADRTVGNVQYFYGDSLTVGGSVYNRAAKEECMLCGSLKSIIYPSGLKETFAFEANRAKINVADKDGDAFNMSDHLYMATPSTPNIFIFGGLRVKEITLADLGNDSILQRRSIVYGSDGAGESPILNGVNYFLREQNKLYDTYGPNFQSHDIAMESCCRTIGSSPFVPIIYTNGAAVMYKKVTEYNGTPDDYYSKTEYSYAVPNQKAVYLSALDLYDWHNDFYGDSHNNNLTLKTVYDASGRKLKQEEYTYSSIRKDASAIVRGREYIIQTNENLPEKVGEGSKKYWKHDYSCTSSATLPSGNIVHDYYYDDNGNSTDVKTETQYFYGNTNDVQQTKAVTLRNSTRQTVEYYHPSQIDNAVCRDMTSRNILSPTIKTVTTQGSSKLVEETPYAEYPSGNGTKMFLLSLLQYQTQDMTAPTVKEEYEYYSTGSIRCIKKNGATRILIWAECGQKLIASIMVNTGNSSSIMSQSTALEEQYGNRPASAFPISQIINMRNENPSALFTVYSYDVYGNLTSVCNPNGCTEYFGYDKMGRLTEQRNNNNEITKQYDYHYYYDTHRPEWSLPSEPDTKPDSGVTGITIIYPSGIIKANQYTLTAQLTPSTSSAKVVWSVTDPNNPVAVVSSDGTVSGVGLGTVEIFATAQSSAGSCTASCFVTVTEGQDSEHSLQMQFSGSYPM